MKEVLLAKLDNAKAAAEIIDTKLWRKEYSGEAKEFAEKCKEKMVNKVERVKRVLNNRYGMDL